MAYVRDVMKKEAVVTKAGDKIQKISKILSQKKISNIPVLRTSQFILYIQDRVDRKTKILILSDIGRIRRFTLIYKGRKLSSYTNETES